MEGFVPEMFDHVIMGWRKLHDGMATLLILSKASFSLKQIPEKNLI